MRMGTDDPGPLQVKGIVRTEARFRVMIGVRKLQSQLVPVTERKCDVRRIGKSLVAMILRALNPVEEESGAPLPAPLVGRVSVHADRGDVAHELVTARSRQGETSIGIDQVTIVAEERFGSPDEALELIILKRDPTDFEVEPGEAAFAFD